MRIKATLTDQSVSSTMWPTSNLRNFMSLAESNLAPGKRLQQKEARRTDIIEAALAEFASQGFTGTKLDDVAVRAGIGKGTIYMYFNSKVSLFEEVVRYTLFPGREMAESYVEDFEGTATELMVNHFRFIYGFFQNEKVPLLLAIVLAEAARFPQLAQFFFDEMIRPSRQLIQDIIERGIASGEFRASASLIHHQLLISPAVLAAIFNLQFHQQEPIDFAVYSEMHIDFILRGLKA